MGSAPRRPHRCIGIPGAYMRSGPQARRPARVQHVPYLPDRRTYPLRTVSPLPTRAHRLVLGCGANVAEPGLPNPASLGAHRVQ
jgi:hypothetical protein